MLGEDFDFGGEFPSDLAHQSVQHASGAAPASTPRIGRRTRAALQAGDAAKHVESGLAGYDPEGQERDLTSVGFGFGKVSSRFFLRLIYPEDEPHEKFPRQLNFDQMTTRL